MRTAQFAFALTLDDLLPRQKRGTPVQLKFQPGQTVKHLVESLGVPHTEIGQVQSGGRPVGLDYQVLDGDLILVEPATPASATDSSKLCFVLDNHLGKLAVTLRLLGFDALYRNNFQDEELAAVSEEQERILLTRDRRLLMRNQVRRGCLLRSTDPRQQVLEVSLRYGMGMYIRPFLRCTVCNEKLQPVDKQVVLHRLEPLTKAYYDDFRICPGCGRVYWKGSHYQRMLGFIEGLRQRLAELEEGLQQLPVGDQVVDSDSDQQHPADQVDQA